MGNLIVAPVILTWKSRPLGPVHRVRVVEGVVLLLLLGIVSQMVFGSRLLFLGEIPYPLTFVLFPFLIWAALRFRTRFLTLAILEVSTVAIWNTLQNIGPFAQGPLSERLLLIQIFLGVVAITSLTLAATMTQRREAEEALRESEERTRTIIDHAQDAVVLMNSAGFITSWNPQAEKIFGWTQQEALGRKMSETIIPQKYRTAHERGLKHFQATGEGPVLNKRLELSALRRDGEEFPVELTVSPLHLGSEIIFSAFIRDITERKRSEEALRRKTEELERSNKELEQFASVASHDLQEPLLKIIAFGDRLKNFAPQLDEKSLDSLERMQNAAFRMRQLIDDLLSLSRVSKMKKPFERVILQDVLQKVLGDLEVRIKDSKAHIKVGSLPTLRGDRLQLQQLFQNLLTNALKYAKKEEFPEIEVRSRDLKNGFVEIAVEDQGTGFDERYLDLIFEPFERLHHDRANPGTGMGLAICKKIVERHGGDITARSELGKGSTFLVTLPA